MCFGVEGGGLQDSKFQAYPKPLTLGACKDGKGPSFHNCACDTSVALTARRGRPKIRAREPASQLLETIPNA